jgi:type IV pilus assembly protein PilY1
MHADSTPSNSPSTLTTVVARLRISGSKKLMLLALPVIAAVSLIVIGQTLPPVIPAITLSADPLYTPSSVDKPAMALVLSAEFPTMGAQYADPDNYNSSTSTDPTYSPTIEYLGYYDAESCYTYDDAGTLAPAGQTSAYKRFIRRGPAIALSSPNAANPTWTSRMCWNGSKSYTKDDGTSPASSTTTNDGFSGNFLNWASSSAIDMLRLSLTGGDRIIDTSTLTVLQRAVIPDGDPISMGNSSNFPAKQLYRTGTSRAIAATAFAAPSYASGVPFFGAVPSAMATAAGTNDIYVANTLNRIYFGFGTALTGNNSSNFSGYTLGSAGGSGAYQVGPIANSSTTLQVTAPAYEKGATTTSNAQPASGRTQCANKDATCSLPAGNWEVWYGKNNSSGWKVAAATGNIPCTDAVLGNPTGSNRQCYYFPYGTTPGVTITPSVTATLCASENGNCTLPVGTTKEVWYGDGSSWKKAPASGNVPCTNAVFGDPISGTAKSCYYLDYSGSWTPTAATTGLNSDGYFFSRVQVCDRNPSTYALKDIRYWNLCRRYSDGATTPHDNFKPTGAIQKYADQLRLAAFSYLLDQNIDRYGGVMRAPIKYVGAKTFDNNGGDNTPSGGNPNQEWDPVTGVFAANPDSNSSVLTADGRATYLSGVTNYLNQFGRTGSVAGRYKKYDPIGEVYYQALRYLQGLQPSPAAVSSISTDMYDGYPVYTTWTDPYGNGRTNAGDYSCLKSNIVVIGDKNTWDYNSRIPSASAANNIPDISGWNSVVTKFEANSSGTYLDGAGVSRSISNPNTPNSAGAVGASGEANLAGTAYWARTHDIRGTNWTNATTAGTAGTTLQRPGLRVKTFVFDVNEYGASNDATARRTSNQLFRAAKYGGFETDPSNTAKNPYNTKGNPFYRDDMTTADNYVWQDTDTRASRQGEANTYYLQSDARGVISAFDDIFARASTAARSIAGGAIQSKNLTQVGDTIYQGTFDTADWSGDVVAIPVNVSASNVVTIDNTFAWTAATVLANRAAARNIVVGKSGATANPVASDFTWGTIETSLQTSLNKSNPLAAADGLGQDRLNYLRGDRSKEGSVFRTRSKLIGDVINAGVVYSGKPTASINDAGYSTFYATNQNRKGAVFVGSNDGMLHAFNGASLTANGGGNEFFAYIPSWLGSKLSALTSPSYVNSHQSYVDGTPAVAEAKVGSDWKTVLVSGTGAGGRGVFALDVTNPETFTKDNVMWEFTNTDDADLGYVTGRPQILKMRTSASSSTTATYKYFAVFGGGVNSYVSDSQGVFSTTGKPTLFILDLSKAAGTAWTLNTNYYKVSLPIDTLLSATLATGLINFRPALSPATQAVTHIFAGDLHGKVWKLDFTTLGTSDWNADKLSYFRTGSNNDGTAMPLFIAKDSAGNAQPITAAPNLVFGPIQDSFYVLFGTGKYLEANDKGTTGTQSVYMVYDNATTTVDTSPRSGATVAVSNRLRLKVGSVSSTGVVTVPAFTIGRATTNTDTDNPRSGWRFDLPNSKERQISNGTVFGDKLIFGSLTPGVTSSNSCTASGGGGTQYTVDILNGSGTSVSSSVGILGEPLVAEISSATTTTASDSTGRRIKTITSQVFQQGSDGVAAGSGSNTNTKTRTVITGRLSWRQINNYQDLKNAP